MLGTCVAGHYQSNDLSSINWKEIDQVISFLTLKFDCMSPRRKVYYYLMYSDYSYQKAHLHRNLSHPKAQQLIKESHRYACTAYRLVEQTGLVGSLKQFAQRRKDLIVPSLKTDRDIGSNGDLACLQNPVYIHIQWIMLLRLTILFMLIICIIIEHQQLSLKLF